MTDYVGQQFGSYRLLRLIGQGGFADIYLGEHVHLGSYAAVKILYARLIDEHHEHFLNEARTLQRLSHPHIIRMLDFGIEDGIPFLIMEYAPHGNLRQRHPSQTKVPLETVVDYVKQITEGLQEAHDQNLIHRDLKPSNVLIGQKNDLLLSDFGVALIAQTTYSQSLASSIAGTVAYVAPEQLQGKPQLASDQYALGIMVYEWLCGERPFHGTVVEMWAQHQSATPAPLLQYVPDLPPEVEQVVLIALAKDPQQRFGNIRAFARALDAASHSEAILALPSGGVLPAGEQAAAKEAITNKVVASASISTPQSVDITEPDEDAQSFHVISNTIADSDSALQHVTMATPTRYGWGKKIGIVMIAIILLLLIGSGTLVYAIERGNTGSNPTTHKDQLVVQNTSVNINKGTPALIATATHKKAGATPTHQPTVSPTAPVIQPTTAPPIAVRPTVAPTVAAKPIPTPTPTPTPTPIPVITPACPAQIQSGSTGSLVKTLQSALNAHYSAHDFSNSPHNFSPPLLEDGIFGANTQSAVEDYQSAKGLEVDGQVGPLTWHSLGYC